MNTKGKPKVKRRASLNFIILSVAAVETGPGRDGSTEMRKGRVVQDYNQEV